MAPRGPFRAVSLDLWFTSLYYPSETENRWREDRVRALRDMLRSGDGAKFGLGEIESSVEHVHAQLETRGLNTGKVDPQALVMDYAESLGAELTIPSDQAGAMYSSAGLAEHPPSLNPELSDVVRALEERNIPIIAITNTARRGATWQEFFRSQGISQFQHIIASCEVGQCKPESEIFLEASRRLAMPLGEILHVGDRWELDVDGARRAGCGAALYQGLWPFYPAGMYPTTDPSLLDDPGLLKVERLEELLEGDLLKSPD